jgi:hypothetical protein
MADSISKAALQALALGAPGKRNTQGANLSARFQFG